MRRLAALFAASLLSGCVTIATINVDGHRAATYVVPFGGVIIERGSSDAVAVHQTALGFWRAGGGFGFGFARAEEARVKAEIGCVALLDGPPSAAIAAFAGITRTTCQHLKETHHEQMDQAVRSAGADR